MRFAPVAGIVGTIAVGFCGLVSNLCVTIPARSQASSQVTPITEIVCHKVEVFSRDSMASQAEDWPETKPESPAHSKLRGKVELLERGKSTFSALNDYTGVFRKQEVVNGVLLDEQSIAIKCRHRPFSVYLLWLTGDVGREVLYVPGQNHGKMIAHDGGWKARIPALTLPTDCLLAMRDARYPVTTAGVVGLIDIMQGVHQNDLRQYNVKSCDIEEQQEFDGRPCTMFVTTYKSPRDSSVYRKSMTWIDREWNVPLHTRHFEWPASGLDLGEDRLDEATLIECYSFTDLKINCNLTDHDFDRTNPEYRFR